MGIMDKAKGAGSFIKDKSLDMISDDKFADLVIKAASKQENVNKALKVKNANYRINSINIIMGVPPSVTFGIGRVSDEELSKG